MTMLKFVPSAFTAIATGDVPDMLAKALNVSPGTQLITAVMLIPPQTGDTCGVSKLDIRTPFFCTTSRVPLPFTAPVTPTEAEMRYIPAVVTVATLLLKLNPWLKSPSAVLVMA